MPGVVVCPSCGFQFQVEGGGAAQCPNCGARATSPNPATVPTPAPQPAVLYRCTSCNGIFDAEQVYDYGDGKMICHRCYAAQAPEPEAAPPADDAQDVVDAWDTATQSQAVSPARPPARKSSNLIGWLVAGVFVAAAVGAVVFVVIPKLKQSADSSELPSRQDVPDQPAAPARQDAKLASASAARDTQAQTVSREAPRTIVQTKPTQPPRAVASNVQPQRTTAAVTPVPKPSPTRSAETTPKQTPAQPAPSKPAAPPAKPASAAQIAALLDSADKTAKAGDKAAALKHYSDALDAAGDQSSIDPELRKRLSRALLTRASLIGQLRAGDSLRQMSLTALVEEGERALRSGKWEAGLDSLTDARTLVEQRSRVAAERLADPNYVPALHGMAVAYLQLKKNAKAAELFDDKAPLGRAAIAAPPAPPPDRAMVWNLAVMDMIQKHRVMRAVKGLMDHYARHPQENDEKMHDMFGTAIAIAYEKFAEDKKPPALLSQAIALYKKHDEALEARRGNGRKRWGVTWISSAEFEQRMQETRTIEEGIREIETGDLARALQALAVAKRGTPAQTGKYGKVYRWNVDPRQVEAARDQVDAVHRRIKSEREKIPQRVWTASYGPIVPPLTPASREAQSRAAYAVAARPPMRKPATEKPVEVAVRDPAPEPVPMREPEPEAAPEPAPANARKAVQRYAAAFPVDRLRLITAAGPVGQAATVSLQDGQGAMMRARVVARSDRLALIEVDAKDVNGGMRFLNLAPGFAGGPVKCVGLPTPNVFLPVVESIDGRAARPPADGAAAWSVTLSKHPRLAGSPMLSAADNTVAGVVLAERDDPPTALPALGAAAIRAFLAQSNAMPPGTCANPDPEGVYQVTINE